MTNFIRLFVLNETEFLVFSYNNARLKNETLSHIAFCNKLILINTPIVFTFIKLVGGLFSRSSLNGAIYFTKYLFCLVISYFGG